VRKAWETGLFLFDHVTECCGLSPEVGTFLERFFWSIRLLAQGWGSASNRARELFDSRYFVEGGKVLLDCAEGEIQFNPGSAACFSAIT
jgi:hypothetical protein